MGEKFIRWQGYSMGQLTFVLNMFFGLSVGALAFSFSLLKDKEFTLSSCPKLSFQIGLVSLCISVFVSCAAVISRLFDFRYTAQKVRADEKEGRKEVAGGINSPRAYETSHESANARSILLGRRISGCDSISPRWKHGGCYVNPGLKETCRDVFVPGGAVYQLEFAAIVAQ